MHSRTQRRGKASFAKVLEFNIAKRIRNLLLGFERPGKSLVTLVRYLSCGEPKLHPSFVVDLHKPAVLARSHFPLQLFSPDVQGVQLLTDDVGRTVPLLDEHPAAIDRRIDLVEFSLQSTHGAASLPVEAFKLGLELFGERLDERFVAKQEIPETGQHPFPPTRRR